MVMHAANDPAAIAELASGDLNPREQPHA
jgi:hypothetical protein